MRRRDSAADPSDTDNKTSFVFIEATNLLHDGIFLSCLSRTIKFYSRSNFDKCAVYEITSSSWDILLFCSFTKTEKKFLLEFFCDYVMEQEAFEIISSQVSGNKKTETKGALTLALYHIESPPEVVLALYHIESPWSYLWTKWAGVWIFKVTCLVTPSINSPPYLHLNFPSPISASTLSLDQDQLVSEYLWLVDSRA